MDKNAIKKYAVWARRELISRVSQKALQYGITDKQIVDANADSVNGKLLSAEEKHQRAALIKQINEDGYEQVMEEVAYTWFNRFCALRFMEVNGYLPTHIRVFSDDENAFKPQILTEAINLDLAGLNIDKVYKLKNDNKTEELYKYLLIVQCNALSNILPGMFQKISDYTELLFPDNLLRTGSVVEQLVTSIPEEDWKDAVQIIGWMYQFYNAEQLEIINGKSIISKKDIPAKTQFFTTDWIVRFLVDNSLGRLWIEGHPDSVIKDNLKYYVDDPKQEDGVQSKLDKIFAKHATIDPKTITCIDPCMGSGHILVYMFDVLVQIYSDYGYNARDAVQYIVRNNIYGIDIDERAAQLAYFAVMMKARQYDRRFFERGIQPQVLAIQESNNLSQETFEYIVGKDENLRTELQKVVDVFKDAKEYGSILEIPSIDYELLYNRFDAIFDDMSLFQNEALEQFLPLIRQAEFLSNKYLIIVTNPPYLGVKKYNSKLSQYIEINYKDYKYDLFSCFLIKAKQLLKENGYIGFLTQQTWLDVDSFEKLRGFFIEKTTLKNIAHLGDNALDGGLGTVAFIYTTHCINKQKTLFIDLSKYSYEEKRLNLYNFNNYYYRDIADFKNIPKMIFSYRISEKVLELFGEKSVFDYTMPRSGLVTRNNELFLKLWYEVRNNNIDYCCDNIDFRKKWYPHTKGGGFRKWYGNYEYVVNWQEDGRDIREATKDAKGGSIVGSEFYFHRGLNWSLSTFSSKFSMRILPKNFIFNVEAPAVFDVKDEEYILALLNSCVGETFLDVTSDHLHYKKNDVGNVPFIFNAQYEERIKTIVQENINESKTDWDSFETSWDFKKHPLLQHSVSKVILNESKVKEKHWLLKNDFAYWEGVCQDRFNKLKANEEELNRIFIDIYGLQDELTPEVEDKDVTVRKADLQREIKSLISYAVGCMFGRYSLDVEGLILAGQPLESRFVHDPHGYSDGIPTTMAGWYIKTEDNGVDVKVCTYAPDVDNIIPICDDEYFEDDIVGKFVKFVEVVYGKETLEENLRFIANALGGNGLPRDVIRDYFLNGFYADHLKVYQKRPIYWLFDSGKKNGFKALIYMHRYQPDTLARMRTDYVHEQQARYRTAIADCEQRLQNANGSERVKLSKKLTTLMAQAEEIGKFEEKVHHLADMMIAIDLDDGVKHNYEIFKDVLAPIK